MIATPEMLAALDPGELFVKITRDGWTIPPDFMAIARANAWLKQCTPSPGQYRSCGPTTRQRECLEGAS